MDNLEKIFEAFRTVSLSLRERTNIELHLKAHMRENPLRVSYEKKIVGAIRDSIRSLETALNSRTFITHPAFAACVLVLCVSIGTSYAAQNALPGQALYSFKTRVNEPLRGVLAVTPEAKVEWSAQLTNRRLKEAEELAATNQLSPVATADIETGLDAAVRNFNSNISLVSKKNDMQAANAQLDLEASLNAHEVILSALPTTQKKNASHITSLVQKHASILNQERSLTEATLTATDSPAVQTAALHLKKSAQAAVDQTQIILKGSDDEHVASSVSAVTAEAASDINAGTNDAKKGHWGKAYNAFQDALRKMKETKDGVETRNWLKVRFGIGLDVTASSSTSTVGVKSSSTPASETKKSD